MYGNKKTNKRNNTLNVCLLMKNINNVQNGLRSLLVFYWMACYIIIVIINNHHKKLYLSRIKIIIC